MADGRRSGRRTGGRGRAKSSRKVVIGRLHKELDSRRTRELVSIAAFATVVLAILLAIAVHRVEEIRLGYSSDALLAELAELERRNEELRQERAELEALDRIEAEARRLGLVAARPEDRVSVSLRRADAGAAAAARPAPGAGLAGGGE